MDLRRHLLELFAPAVIGDEVVPGARLVSASTELGLRITVELADRPVHIEVVPAAEGGRYAARSKALLFSYRSGGGEGEFDASAGKRLCEELAALASRNEERVLAQLKAEAQAAKALEEGRTKIREIHVERLLEPAHSGSLRYYTLSPYVGCLIGCRFCYAQTRLSWLRRLAELPEVPWGSWVDVRVNAAEILASELATRTPQTLKFCPIVSDPYHAIEKRYGITKSCLEVLANAPQWPVIVLTRSHLIQRDAELLASIPLARAGVSLPSIDEAVIQHFEPRASSVAERLESLRVLKAAGVRTIVVAQPMLPGPLEPFVDALAELADSVSIDVLRGEVGATTQFADPRYSHCRDENWQRERAIALTESLKSRGVAVWEGELPPEPQS
jgi:DNA repair photolyase